MVSKQRITTAVPDPQLRLRSGDVHNFNLLPALGEWVSLGKSSARRSVYLNKVHRYLVSVNESSSLVVC
jgi:hypothetical protein